MGASDDYPVTVSTWGSKNEMKYTFPYGHRAEQTYIRISNQTEKIASLVSFLFPKLLLRFDYRGLFVYKYMSFSFFRNNFN